MRHDEAILLLTDCLEGRLEGAVRPAVLEHLAACSECQALAETYALLEWGRAWHPPSAGIVGFALGVDPPAGDATARVEDHLRRCERCTEEVRLIRAAEEAAVEEAAAADADAAADAAARIATGADDRPAVRGGDATAMMSNVRRWRFVAVAAVTMCAVLSYPAYIGLSRIPRLDAEVGRLESRLAAMTENLEDTRRAAEAALQAAERARAGWPGIVPVQTLLASTRGTGAPQRLIAIPGQSHLLVAIEAPLPPRGGEGAYVFEVLGGGGSIVWATQVGADDLRRRLAGSPEGVLAIPVDRIPEGICRMRLRRVGTSPETVFEIAFEVQGLK
jgi:hypothetical protein